MTLGDINSRITFLTGANTTNDYPNADRVISINKYKDIVLNAIFRSQDGIEFDDYSITSSYPLAKFDLTANQPDYKFSSSLWSLVAPQGGADLSASSIKPLRIKRLELAYNGTNWYKAEPINLGETSVTQDQTSVNNFFQTTKPFYEVRWNALWLKPVPTATVTKGGLLEFDRASTDYTSSDLSTGTAIPGFDSNLHDILAIGASYDYAISKTKDNRQDLEKELNKMFMMLQDQFGKKDTDRNWQLKPNPISYE